MHRKSRYIVRRASMVLGLWLSLMMAGQGVAVAAPLGHLSPQYPVCSSTYLRTFTQARAGSNGQYTVNAYLKAWVDSRSPNTLCSDPFAEADVTINWGNSDNGAIEALIHWNGNNTTAWWNMGSNYGQGTWGVDTQRVPATCAYVNGVFDYGSGQQVGASASPTVCV